MVWNRRGLGAISVVCLLLVPLRADEHAPRAQESDYWFFRPVERPAVPLAAGSEHAHPIDAFIALRLTEAGIAPAALAAPADPRTAIRRLWFDLVGLAPRPEDVERFVADERPNAWERCVDALLASPRYGERQARHWLDVVRYAESDGFRADDYRPLAWKYRDWVIRSLNGDKPYDRFLAEQIAGDELYPDSPDAIIATGFLRHWPYEHNQRDLHLHRNEILNDITDVTGEAMLGLSLRCARCHDHKFDPIKQDDYYSLRAFFEAIMPRDDLVAASETERHEHERREREWLERSAEIRSEIEAIEAPIRARLEQSAVDKFTRPYQKILATPFERLSPLDRQIRFLADLQLEREARALRANIKGDDKQRWDALRSKLDELDVIKPRPLPGALAVVDVGPVAPPTIVPGRGAVEPAFLSILGEAAPSVEPIGASTGRRATLARWLGSAENRLVHRVLVNRIWQLHFGRGIVPTSNDFGHQGELPSHPELLDWLTAEFIESGMSLKALHRLIVTSEAYRRTATVDASDPAVARAIEIDPDNRLLWRMSTRRIDAETLRDAALTVSGELHEALGGPSVGDADPRRSIYVKVLRNSPSAMMNAFDGPDNHNSCGRRDVTTTAPQALLLLNGDWTLARARALEARTTPDCDDERFVDDVVSIALGRPPASEESEMLLRFLRDSVARGNPDARLDVCHMILNTNEFLYVD